MYELKVTVKVKGVKPVSVKTLHRNGRKTQQRVEEINNDSSTTTATVIRLW